MKWILMILGAFGVGAGIYMGVRPEQGRLQDLGKVKDFASHARDQVKDYSTRVFHTERGPEPPNQASA